MTQTHTEGPWHIGGNPDSSKTVYCDTHAIADCYGIYSLQNARLIAAAPELLEALQMVEGWLVDYVQTKPHLDNYQEGSQPTLREVSAAIAKTRGEA
jgi:hypothetical protein